MPRIAQKAVDAQKTWEDRITRAKTVRKNWKDLFRVDMARDYFEGKQNPGYPAHEWITINKIYAHLKSQLPALYAADPYFYVKLRRSFSPNPMEIALWEKRGTIRQAYLNYLKEEIGLKNTVRLNIQDAFFAMGVAKVHYYADMSENPDSGKPMLGDDGYPLTGDDGESLMEPEEVPINERYCVTRIHPDDFVWDEDAGPLPDTWKWCAQCVRMTREDAQGDRRFNKAALKAIIGKGETKDDEYQAREQRKKGGDVRGRSESHTFDTGEKKEPPEIIVTWEIYDLKRGRWTVIAEGGETPLVDEQPLPAGTEKHPFAFLRFTLRDDSPWPIPPLSQGLDPQKEYNIARSDVLKHRKRFNRKYQVLETALSDPDAEIAKLITGDDGTCIKVMQQNAVTPIADAPLDQMRYLELSALNQDMIELLGGSSDEARGIAGADSATQAGILDKRLEMKEGDSMSMVVDFVKDIARKLDQLVQTHITRDEAVRVTGPQGEYWELVRATDYESVNGEYEYAVNVGATIPQMPQMERASWTAFLTLLASFPHLLTQRHLLKRMAEMHHIEDEAMLNDLATLGKQIMGGQVPMPGAQGSQAGVSEDRPVSATGGQAGGAMAWNKPGAGNLQ